MFRNILRSLPKFKIFMSLNLEALTQFFPLYFDSRKVLIEIQSIVSAISNRHDLDHQKYYFNFQAF